MFTQLFPSAKYLDYKIPVISFTTVAFQLSSSEAKCMSSLQIKPAENTWCNASNLPDVLKLHEQQQQHKGRSSSMRHGMENGQAANNKPQSV